MKIALNLLSFGVSVVSSYSGHEEALFRKLIRGGASDFSRLLNEDEEKFPVDISDYSLHFEKCQAVKKHSTEDRGGSIERYVIFRLCPEHDCSLCNMEYGEYIMDLTDYLQILSGYFHETQGAMCETCDECEDPENPDAKAVSEAKLEDFGSSCASCHHECKMLSDMEAKGYVDATDFLRCSKIYADPDGKQNYYAGPVCSDFGEAVTIGVFTDEYCEKLDSSKNIREFLHTNDGVRMNIGYSFLQLTYRETCFSCEEDGIEGLHDLKADEQDQDNVKTFCEKIYTEADKCETKHGFAHASHSAPVLEKDSVEMEEMTCDFIQIVKSGRQSDDVEEEYNDYEFKEIDEKREMDKQSLLMVVVGVGLSLIIVVFKLGCSGSKRRNAIKNQDKLHDDEYRDDFVPIKTHSDDPDVTEESSHSSCEETELTIQVH